MIAILRFGMMSIHSFWYTLYIYDTSSIGVQYICIVKMSLSHRIVEHVSLENSFLSVYYFYSFIKHPSGPVFDKIICRLVVFSLSILRKEHNIFFFCTNIILLYIRLTWLCLIRKNLTIYNTPNNNLSRSQSFCCRY